MAITEPTRERLPDTRPSITHKFIIGSEMEGFFTVGLYPDGRPGELFVTIDQEGSFARGAISAWSVGVSMCLQHGISIENLMRKYAHWRFAPGGFTQCPAIPNAKSVIDYIARWLLAAFVEKTIDLTPYSPSKGGLPIEPEPTTDEA